MSRALSLLVFLSCVVIGLGVSIQVAMGAPAAAADPAVASPGEVPVSDVVGGHPAMPGEWPDAVAVMDDTGFAFCSGTLVAPQVVITAGHCVGEAGAPPPTQVKINAVDSAGTGEVIAVTQATAYPSWESTYDISVLVLDHPSTTPPRAVATSCAVDPALADGAPVTLVGFGATTQQGDDQNTTLMVGQAQIQDAACSGNGCVTAVSPGGEFVAGGAGVDSCFGDSGGPVYLTAAGETVLAGVVSRGVDDSPTPCGGGGIYVRPDAVIDWIEQTAGMPVTRPACDGAGGGDDPGTGDGSGGDDTGDGSGSGGGGDGTGDTGTDPDGTGGTGQGVVVGGCSAGGPGTPGPTWPVLVVILVLATGVRLRSTPVRSRRRPDQR